MNTKYTIILVMYILSFCISTISATQKTKLVIWSKDGTQVAYALSEKPMMTFTDSNLIISANNIEISYALANVARFSYEDNEGTSITNIQTDEAIFKLDGDYLLFPYLDANNTVSIYSLNGKLVFKKTVRHNGEYTFPLSNLSTGIYMVNVNGLIYKIVKK